MTVGFVKSVILALRNAVVSVTFQSTTKATITR